MEEQTVICKRCGKPAPHGVLFSDGECLVCYQKALPQCQFPGCTTKCDGKKDLLCTRHFQELTHNCMSEENTKMFVQKFAEIGIRIRVFQSWE